jgi:hypothetical protein
LRSLECVGESRKRSLTVIDANRVDAFDAERLRESGGGMPSDRYERLGNRRSNASNERQNVVRFERMHARDSNEPGSAFLQMVLYGPCETKVQKVHVMTAVDETASDVLHSERLDPEERSEAETLVARHGA